MRCCFGNKYSKFCTTSSNYSETSDRADSDNADKPVRRRHIGQRRVVVVGAQAVSTAVCRIAVAVCEDMPSTGSRSAAGARACSSTTKNASTSSNRSGVTAVSSSLYILGTIKVGRWRHSCGVMDGIDMDPCSRDSIADDIVELAGQVRNPIL